MNINEILVQWFEFWRNTFTGVQPYVYSISDNLFLIILIITIILSTVYYFVSFAILVERKKKISIQEKEYAPFVTVQIPTYNELAAINCAKKCMEFDYPKDNYEILIGDDSNDSDISNKLMVFARGHSKITVVKRESNIGYKPGNLNNMLKYSKGEIITIFDSDFLPEKDFLRRIVRPFADDEKICAVQTRWSLIEPHRNLISSLSSTILAVVHHVVLPFSEKANAALLCGSAEAVRKDVLIKLGGWKAGSLTEDIEYSLRALNNGYKIKYLDDLECRGEVPYLPKDMYKQQMRWSYGVVSSYIEHGASILKNKTLGIKDKLAILFFPCSGYVLTLLLLLLFFTGTISFVTHPREPIDFVKFFFNTFRNILLTSGFVMASFVALLKLNQLKYFGKVIISLFSYGLIASVFVNLAILKAVFKKPMKWYMLNKIGNDLKSNSLAKNSD